MTSPTTDQPAEEDETLACPECHAICRDRNISSRSELRCCRCGARVKCGRGARSIHASLAMSISGLVLFIPANVEPILTFDIQGNTQSNLIITGVIGLIAQGYSPIAALVFFCAIAAPALHLAALFYLLTACSLELRWPLLEKAYHLSETLESWNLIPVYAAGTVVSVVKLEMLGTVEWRVGSLCVAAFSLCSMLTVQFLDHVYLQKKIRELS